MSSPCCPMPRKLLVGGGLQRSVKKVAPPLVPEPAASNRLSGSSFSSGYGSQAGAADRVSLSSLGEPSPSLTDEGFWPSVAHQTVVYADVHVDQGIDPGARSDSPSGSSASRHSSSSLDSGRGSSDSKVTATRGPLDGGGGDPPTLNVAEMLLHGVPDVEILATWLASLHFEEYVSLFSQAGYDMPTISRMTPEDLTAIGITKPNHRRKLKAEIGRLNITDGIPDYKPDSLLTWLHLLHLEQYYEPLRRQHITTVDQACELTWEDLEDIGISKLGHQKKMMLAIKRIEDLSKRPSQVAEMFPSPARPSTLACYHLQGQEVPIATHRSGPASPSTTTPELKTFQAPPSLPFYPNQISSHRGHSLESLDMDDSVSTLMHSTDSWYDALGGWRHYETDNELVIHEGTASLHRPKGLIKPKPVAKIAAKTRPIETSSDILKNLNIEAPPTLKSTAEWQHSTSQLYGTLRKRNQPPPPPPKRTHSIKSTDPRSLDEMKDEAFATCVKGLTSRFNMASQDEEVPSESAKDLPDLSKLRQRRKDSSDSLVSIASTDSNSLPFANENVGTIKQRTAKPFSSLESCSLRRSSHSSSGYMCEASEPLLATEEMKTTKEAMKPVQGGDVIDDIELMLFNLSSQLDAMLEEEARR